MTATQATKLAKLLLPIFGLTDWEVCCWRKVDLVNLEVSRRGLMGRPDVGFAAVCVRAHKVILLSPYVFAQLGTAEARDVILHEIAHALASGDGHDAEWQSIARRIGVPEDDIREHSSSSAPITAARYEVRMAYRRIPARDCYRLAVESMRLI